MFEAFIKACRSHTDNNNKFTITDLNLNKTHPIKWSGIIFRLKYCKFIQTIVRHGCICPICLLNKICVFHCLKLSIFNFPLLLAICAMCFLNISFFLFGYYITF